MALTLSCRLKAALRFSRWASATAAMEPPPQGPGPGASISVWSQQSGAESLLLLLLPPPPPLPLPLRLRWWWQQHPQKSPRKKSRVRSLTPLSGSALLTPARPHLLRVCPRKTVLKKRLHAKPLPPLTCPPFHSQHWWMMNPKPGSRCIQSSKVIQ